MSKGSKPRPFSVSQSQFGQSWDQIFGKKNDELRRSGNESNPVVGGETHNSEQHTDGTVEKGTGRAQ